MHQVGDHPVGPVAELREGADLARVRVKVAVGELVVQHEAEEELVTETVAVHVLVPDEDVAHAPREVVHDVGRRVGVLGVRVRQEDRVDLDVSGPPQMVVNGVGPREVMALDLDRDRHAADERPEVRVELGQACGRGP